MALEKYVNLNYLVSCNFVGQHSCFVDNRHTWLHSHEAPSPIAHLPSGNYILQGFHKAVKKHDKMLPLAPCQQFYMHVLRNQPWVQVGALTPVSEMLSLLKLHYQVDIETTCMAQCIDDQISRPALTDLVPPWSRRLQAAPLFRMQKTSLWSWVSAHSFQARTNLTET